MILHGSSAISSPSPVLLNHHQQGLFPSHSLLPLGYLKLKPTKLSLQAIFQRFSEPVLIASGTAFKLHITSSWQIFQRQSVVESLTELEKLSGNLFTSESMQVVPRPFLCASACSIGQISCLILAPEAHASDNIRTNAVYEISELFELGIQLSYLLLLLGFLGIGTFFVLRQVLVRRELDLSAKELQEQVRSGDASATEYFELGAVMLRRKVYPAATRYLLQAIKKWDGDDQDLAQVYNALGVSYVLDGKLDKAISQFETAVKLQPGYVTSWNNLGDAYEKKKDFKSALKAFEEVLLFDPNNKVARPRRDTLEEKVKVLRGVSVKSKERSST